MPLTGWDTVTVPGVVAGWVALHDRFGQLPFADLFAHAIRHATDGFPVPFVIARHWALQAGWFAGSPGFDATFLPQGRAPVAGERFRNPPLAASLADIAASRGESFYHGALAAAIERFAHETGGPLRRADLAAFRPEWVAPLNQPYGRAIVHELPPNGQGIAALIALGILAHLPVAGAPLDDPDAAHLTIEAMRLALAELDAHVADPASMPMSTDELLDPERLARMAARIDPERSSGIKPVSSRAEGTVYLAAADRSGMMVSLIQSNYRGFGSGLVVPGTGIALHNRGAGFATRPASPNLVAPGKRPLNTIIPGFITQADGAPLAAFGVMGGSIQAQAHVQVVQRLLDHDLQPQAALDAPRWRINDAGALQVEDTMCPQLQAALAGKGHRLAAAIPVWSHESGAGQIVMRHGEICVAASDGRRDGAVLVA
jgi:gamma-glutamyltranspeptidase/glutathione hydrolase